VLAAWPLVDGRAQDGQVSFRQVSPAWRAAAAGLDRELPASSRAIVLPGDLFSFYDWGGTVDPILPALSRRPVTERAEVPYADLRATDLLFTIDGLVHQGRLLPGQLPPLLSLIGARAVVTGSDDDLPRSDAPPPADVAAELTAQPGLTEPTRTYGPSRAFEPSGLGPLVRLAQVRRYDLPASRGLVRVEPAAAPIVVDGSAETIAGLAAFGGLRAGEPVLYSGDLSAGQVRSALAGGGELVMGDSNRRRAFAASSLDQNTGPALTPSQNVSADGLILDPFGRGQDFQTVASYVGVRSVESPASPQRVQFPEHAPYAAIDGSRATAWLADPTLDPARRWLQVDFDRARDIPYVDLVPYGDAGGIVTGVRVGGRSFTVHPGLNRLLLSLRAVRSLRVTLTAVSAPAPGAAAGAGGIRELRVPGVHAVQELRLPQDAARALAGTAMQRVSLVYVFERTTGDRPFARDLAHAGRRRRRDRDQAPLRRARRPPVHRVGLGDGRAAGLRRGARQAGRLPRSGHRDLLEPVRRRARQASLERARRRPAHSLDRGLPARSARLASVAPAANGDRPRPAADGAGRARPPALVGSPLVAFRL
jgi:hypothetical protein